MNLLLFGVPGAGKTEFVKYLAKQLDKPLCVKNAGDLLNCYVGGTEQRIIAAFAEAEANGEILFIDEGMLCSAAVRGRAKAGRSVRSVRSFRKWSGSGASSLSGPT